MLKIHEFLAIPDILSSGNDYRELIEEMKIEAILVTENSPYAEVRAVVSQPSPRFDSMK